MPPFDLSIMVGDEESLTVLNREYNIKLNYDRMRVDGGLLGYGDARCYLPIFPHSKDQTGTNAKMEFERDSYYLGSHFMVDTTVIFDNSPFTERGHRWA